MKKILLYFTTLLVGLVLSGSGCNQDAVSVYSISSSALSSFGSVEEGYIQPEAKTVTITNTGVGPVTLIALPAVSHYTLTELSTYILAVGETATFTIRPNPGLTAGSYNPTFNVIGSNGVSTTIRPTFTVTADEWPFSGNGTSGSPYLINTPEKLVEMSNLVNAGTGTYRTAYYRQTASIDLCDIPDWTPMGTDSLPFRGSYDGGGNVISNLKITGNDNYRGLFGKVNAAGSLIRNVRLSGVSISGSTYVGGVVGMLEGGTVQNCCVWGGYITAISYAGGIVGINASSAVVQNCYVSGPISITSTTDLSSAGGVAGENWGTVQNCYATAKVSSNAAGGVVGFNNGLIAYCYATGAVVGANPYPGAGGVAGMNSSWGKIRNCIALNRSVLASGSGIGRVVGENYGTLTNNYARSSGMTLSSSHTTVPGLNSKDGANASSSSLQTQLFYTQGSNWNGGAWNFSTLWQMGTNLPILRGFTGATQNPSLTP